MNVNIEDFWDKFLSEDTLELYDEALSIFSTPLSDELKEEYDFIEVILEIIGHHETAKKFDKIIAFSMAVRTHNPDLYEKARFYIYEALISYYIFKREEATLAQLAEELVREPDEQIDIFLDCFYKLVFNNYAELAENLVEQTYETISTSDEVIGGDKELADCIYYLELERLFRQFQSSGQLALSHFKERLAPFNLKLTDIFLAQTEKGFGAPIEAFPPGTLQKLHEEDIFPFLYTVELLFYRHMLEKGVPFLTTGYIIPNFHDLWLNINQRTGKPKKISFRISLSQLTEFIQSQQGFLIDRNVNLCALIWGLQYIYDFLLLIQLIDESYHKSFSETIGKFKVHFAKLNSKNLWKFTFVHNWPKPESITEEAWEAEKALFVNSFDVDPYPDEKTYSWEQIDPNYKMPDMDDLFLAFQKVEEEIKPLPFKKSVPKIGRNEKVTVRYNDGSIKKNIKFKIVQRDLENGNCELI